MCECLFPDLLGLIELIDSGWSLLKVTVMLMVTSCAPDERKHFSLILSLSLSEPSFLARPSSWVRAPWSWPSLSPSSSLRNPPAPPLPPSCPSVRSHTQTAKSPCPRWLASISTRLSRAATRRTLPQPAMRTLSHCCRTVLFDWRVDGPQRAGLTSLFD